MRILKGILHSVVFLTPVLLPYCIFMGVQQLGLKPTDNMIMAWLPIFTFVFVFLLVCSWLIVYLMSYYFRKEPEKKWYHTALNIPLLLVPVSCHLMLWVVAIQLTVSLPLSTFIAVLNCTALPALAWLSTSRITSNQVLGHIVLVLSYVIPFAFYFITRRRLTLEYKWRKTMNEKQLLQAWKEEENVAHIRGWDFSHIAGRHTEDTNFPWDYKQRILTDLSPDMKLLDVDTGGGEFLLSLGHPKENTSATEAYPPNAKLCRDTLIPMGIDFREAVGNSSLPFEDESFHMVIDRHGDYNAQEFYRILKKGGLVVMQQVGAENDAELAELLLGTHNPPFPEMRLEIIRQQFEEAGFEVLEAQECFRPIRFMDIGALVWFARIIEWEFPGFSVEGCKERLFAAQKILEQQGYVEGQTHRIILVARK